MTPSLVAVAHGSRDPRSADTMGALVDRVRAARPGLDVRLGFLDLSDPPIGEVLDTVPHGVVVPLLLGSAYHATVDVPEAVAAARAAHPDAELTVADVLGCTAALEVLALRRLAEAGADLADPATGVVLASAGSSDRSATAAVDRLAQRWDAAHAAPVVAAFAASAHPTVPEAVARLRARGARRLAVASWFLAPGRLPDAVAADVRALDPAAVVADPLGADAAVADLVLARYDATVPVSAQPCQGTAEHSRPLACGA